MGAVVAPLPVPRGEVPPAWATVGGWAADDPGVGADFEALEKGDVRALRKPGM